MKALVLELIRREQISQGDDLARIEAQCSRLASFEMDMEYGESGQTAQDILNAARRRKEELSRALQWAERKPKGY